MAECSGASPVGDRLRQRSKEASTMDFGDILLAVAPWWAMSVLLIVLLLTYIAYALYADRKIWAAVQLRRGPTWVGPWACCRASPTCSSSC
jgi:hypothetical protein